MKVCINYKDTEPLRLITFSLDVELYGLFMSVYHYGYKHIFYGSKSQDDWICIAQELGFFSELSSFQTNPSATPISGKTTTVLAALGFGSWLCYKLFRLNRKNGELSPSKSCSNSYNKSMNLKNSRLYKQAMLKAAYFGPREPFSDIDKKHVYPRRNEPISSCDSDWSPATKNDYKARKLKRRYNRGWMLNRRINSDRNSVRSNDSSVGSMESSPRHNNLCIQRDESVESMCSDTSFDLSASADNASTVDKMNQLQQEIDFLKDNCLSMDEEFEIIKINRNLPGLSSLMQSNELGSSYQESAKACFKGLYSLTTINRSMSFEQSVTGSLDDDNSLVGNSMYPSLEEESTSLEWDMGDTNACLLPDLDEMYCKESEDRDRGTDGILPTEISWSSDGFDMLDSPSGNNNLNFSFGQTETNRKISAGSIEEDFFFNINKMNQGIIGPLVSLSDDNNLSNSKLPLNLVQILPGYCLNKTNHSVASVKEDGSSFIRATLFVILSQAVPFSNCQTAFGKIKQTDFQKLFSMWNFGPLTTYSANKLKGMSICLNTLDGIVSCLKSSTNRIVSLHTWLNTDPTLDMHMVEAVKLLILADVLSPQSLIYSYIKTESFLLEGLSLQQETEVLVQFINNINKFQENTKYIKTTPLQEMKMTILALAFNITLHVIKPSAYGSYDFLRTFPTSAENNWESILLLSEDYKFFQVVI